MNVIRKSSILLSITLCFMFFWTSMALATSKYVYNGNQSSGWSGSGTFNLATDAGYDGSMYWRYGQSGSIGSWDFGLSSSNVNYWAYIPNHHAYGYAIYHCWYTAQRQDVGVNQRNYSNQWVYLGTFNTSSDSSTMMEDQNAATSDQIGWDEFCYTY